MSSRSGKTFKSNLSDGVMFALASGLFWFIAVWWPLAYDVPIISSNFVALIENFSLGEMTVFVGSLAAQAISAVFAVFAGIQALTFHLQYNDELVKSRGWLIGFFVATPPLIGFMVALSLLTGVARVFFTLYGFGKL